MNDVLEAKLNAHGTVLFAVALEIAAIDRRAARRLSGHLTAALRGAEDNGRAEEAAELRMLAVMIGHANGTPH